jgi:hypothetical protein
MADRALVDETEGDVILRGAQALRGTLRKSGPACAVAGTTRAHAARAFPSTASQLHTDVRSLTAAIAAVQDDIEEKKSL